MILNLDKLPAKAELFGTADDFARFFVNGRFCGENIQWGLLNRLDIRPLLKRGKNIIVIEGTDGGALPCGIIGGVMIDDKFIATDKNWKTSVVPFQTNPDYANPEMANDWQNATIIAPFGGGVWGNRLKVKKQAEKTP